MIWKGFTRVCVYTNITFWISCKNLCYRVSGEFIMFAIPPSLMSLFEERLRSKAIPERSHSFYKKWLRYYSAFCRKYNCSDSVKENLPLFLKKLKEKSSMIYTHTIKSQTKKDARSPLEFYWSLKTDLVIFACSSRRNPKNKKPHLSAGRDMGFSIFISSPALAVWKLNDPFEGSVSTVHG